MWRSTCTRSCDSQRTGRVVGVWAVDNLGTTPESDVERRLAELLRAERPQAFCDNCLAFKLAAAYDSVVTAARRLSARPGYHRRIRLCHRCWGTREMTELR